MDVEYRHFPGTHSKNLLCSEQVRSENSSVYNRMTSVCVCVHEIGRAHVHKHTLLNNYFKRYDVYCGVLHRYFRE